MIRKLESASSVAPAEIAKTEESTKATPEILRQQKLEKVAKNLWKKGLGQKLGIENFEDFLKRFRTMEVGGKTKEELVKPGECGSFGDVMLRDWFSDGWWDDSTRPNESEYTDSDSYISAMSAWDRVWRPGNQWNWDEPSKTPHDEIFFVASVKELANEYTKKFQERVKEYAHNIQNADPLGLATVNLPTVSIDSMESIKKLAKYHGLNFCTFEAGLNLILKEPYPRDVLPKKRDAGAYYHVAMNPRHKPDFYDQQQRSLVWTMDSDGGPRARTPCFDIPEYIMDEVFVFTVPEEKQLAKMPEKKAVLKKW